MYKNNSFRHNVSGIGFNVALVDTALDENVACESPIGAPCIANDPEVDSVENAPSDDDDAVIHGFSITGRIVVHAAPT